MGAACSQRTIWVQGHTWEKDWSSWDERAKGKAIGDTTNVGRTSQDEEVSPHTHFFTFSDFPFTQFSQLKDFITRTPPSITTSIPYAHYFHLEFPPYIPFLPWIFQWCLKQNLSYTFFFHAAQMAKNLPAMQETQVWSLGWEDPLEKRLATHSSILAWRILWTEEFGGLPSMGFQRVRHDWVTNTSTFSFRRLAK